MSFDRHTFYEEQKFPKRILMILVSITAGTLVSNCAAIYMQFIEGKSFGDKPMGDVALALFIFITSLLTIVFTVLAFKARMKVKIDKSGIHYRYFPFVVNWKFIARNKIKSWKVSKYFTAGYGLRYGINCKTLNVKGSQGLEIEFHEGRSLRLGTQQPDAITNAMEKFTNRKDN